MLRVDGEVKLSGCVSYAPQSPWIMSATIRDNIVFSYEYDETFYHLVLDGKFGFNPYDEYVLIIRCQLVPSGQTLL